MPDKVLHGWSASSPLGGLRFALKFIYRTNGDKHVFTYCTKVLNGQTHIEMHFNKLTGKTMKMNRKS